MNSSIRALCLAACSWLAFACSSGDDTPAVPRGPADFAIGSVASVGGEVSSSGATLEIDCSEPLLVNILPELDASKLGDFLLAPPGDCGSKVNCGWLVLTVEDSSGEPIVETAYCSTPLRVDLPPEQRRGEFVFRAELRDADGVVVLTEQDVPLTAEYVVQLTTSTDCATE